MALCFRCPEKLARNRWQNSLSGGLEARVLITDDALNPFHATSEQAFQEGSPVDFRFAQQAADSQYASMAIQKNADGH
jgi:hypothetical protein